MLAFLILLVLWRLGRHAIAPDTHQRDPPLSDVTGITLTEPPDTGSGMDGHLIQEQACALPGRRHIEGDYKMEMTGKQLPLYRFDREPHPSEHVVAYGNINDEPCHLSVICEDGDHLLVATVNDNRVAISGKELLGAAASLAQKENRNG